jgi:hypothetical protein
MLITPSAIKGLQKAKRLGMQTYRWLVTVYVQLP